MKEKKVIDYTRTYRRIEADKKKCILYIVILLLLGFLLMWTDRKSTRLNSSHITRSRMPSSA